MARVARALAIGRGGFNRLRLFLGAPRQAGRFGSAVEGVAKIVRSGDPLDIGGHLDLLDRFAGLGREQQADPAVLAVDDLGAGILELFDSRFGGCTGAFTRGALSAARRSAAGLPSIPDQRSVKEAGRPQPPAQR